MNTAANANNQGANTNTNSQAVNPNSQGANTNSQIAQRQTASEPNKELNKEVNKEASKLEAEVKRRIPNNISQEFQNFLADIETLAKSLTSLTGNELDAAKAQLSERIVSAKATLENVRSNLTQQTYDAMAKTDTYVREQPWRAVGVGTSIGFLLGLILARRN